ncbi:hypothetical protein ACGILS_02015 [Streptomyces albidoflavus]|uniref:hypothetical protein n=1 Tax=Streptomyces albidoflavus TaxID=1886 RepID=UPI001021B2B7|nr:hypothetical protein [Streptomyces albidoflavus]MCU7705172.1 hypothetical protein [Streptomyces albidoflavus]RZD76598.1 hypothetical protein C0Q61_18985 [Streptomyces albidoflavus]
MDGLDRTRGVRLRRSATAMALLGMLAGCGLGEPKQTYEQAYEAMRPDAMAAMKEAWPGVEMEKDSADLEECGGLDISADKDASKLSAHVTYRGNTPPGDERSLAELARAAGKRLMERGWRSGVEGRIPDEGGLKFSVKSSSRVRLQMEKPGVDGWAVVLVYADEPNDYGVSMSVSTKCLRNPAWGRGEEG